MSNGRGPGMSLGFGSQHFELRQSQVLAPKLKKSVTLRYEALKKLKKRKEIRQSNR